MAFKAFKKSARDAGSFGGTLKDRLAKSVLWVAADQVLLTILGLGRSVITARLLAPEIFGLMGLAQTAMSALDSFTRPGIGEALIARRQAFEEAAATAFTLLVLRGFLLSAAVWLLAPVVARFYQTDQLKSILVAVSVVYVVRGLSNVNSIAKRRELEFRQLTYLGQATAWATTIVTLAATVWLRNVWALVIGQVASAAIWTLLSYVLIEGRPRFAFNREVARELLSYGKFVTGSSVVLFIASQADLVLIGKLLGANELGYYVLAFTISQLITTNLSKVASSIMMPAYSKLQLDLSALRLAYLRAFSLVMFVVMPATAGTILVAEPLVEVVYGDQWRDAIVPLRVLSCYGFFLSLVVVTGYLFQGIGMPALAFRLGIVRIAVIGVLLIPMIGWQGIFGAALAVTIAVAVQWMVGLVYLRRTIAVGFLDQWRSIVRVIWTTMIMVVAVLGVMSLTRTSTLLGLLAAALTGTVVYAALNWSELVRLRRDLLGAK